MLLRKANPLQLTYCTNIHPGESLPEVRAVLKEQVSRVKRALSPDAPFATGLRLSAAAADALAAPEALADFRASLAELGLYCFTINGFPYGAFHGARVKEAVYEPDWLTTERVRYTKALARILAELLPPGMSGSISTVPGCFKPRAHDEVNAAPRMAEALLQVAAELFEIERRSGKTIQVALEPEPHCFLETTAEAIEFFESQIFSTVARARFAALTGASSSDAEGLLRRLLGVCLDTCHASVEFESPLDAYRRLRGAGIRVGKLQISAGLRLPEATAERLELLKSFENDVYLHQVVVRTAEQRLQRFLDLDQALASPPGGEWRVHFHVPIFQRELGAFESTQADLVPLLQALARDSEPADLEVETYTWDVLPERFRALELTQAIERELGFVLDTMALRPFGGGANSAGSGTHA